MVAVTIFAIFGALLGVGFFLDGVSMSPVSALQQQVQYIAWAISVAGWVLLALAIMIAQLRGIAELLQSFKQKIERAEPKSS